MRRHFPLYYHLTDKEKLQLFKSKDCYFVFDTNALLDIYRLGKDTAEKVLLLLDKFKDRIVIPMHVAREYHEHMLDIITEICAKYDDFLCHNATEKILGGLFSSLKIENFPSVKRKFVKYLKPAIDEMFREVEAEHRYMKDQFQTWDLQGKLSDALGEMVLEGFTDEEIREIEKEGGTRYSKNIPPGYKDLKTKNTNVYGDLIIWKEILKCAKANRCSVVFIGRDMKEDWIQKLHGMICGPRQELLDEYNKYSPTGKFHIYTLDQFLEFANGIDKVLDDAELSEVKEIAEMQSAIKANDAKSTSSVPVKMCALELDKAEMTPTEEKSAKGIEKQLKVG